MSRQPETNEEYIKFVTEQAKKQVKENVPSHKELVENYQKQSRSLHEKESFYTVILILLIISFVGVKMFPNYLGLSDSQL